LSPSLSVEFAYTRPAFLFASYRLLRHLHHLTSLFRLFAFYGLWHQQVSVWRFLRTWAALYHAGLLRAYCFVIW